MATAKLRYISSEELRQHNSPTDLWISIHGKIYDVSNWINDHPGGGIPLVDLAGEDATDPFTALHPISAWKHLDRFFIGIHLSDHRVSEISKDYHLLACEISNLGLFEEKGHVILFSFGLIFSLFFSAVFLIVGSTGVLSHIIAGVLIGIVWIQSGWVAHDSGHVAMMPTPWLNRIVQLISANCIAGVSINWWKRTHNAHHVACNSLDFDPDLQHIPLFAVSSKLFDSLRSYFYERQMKFDFLAKCLISCQHWTFYPVMCVARLNLFAQSIYLLSWDKTMPGRGLEIAGMIVFLIWYPYLVSFLPSNGERFMFIAACFSITGIQHVLFCLSHFSSDIYIGRPKGKEWCEIQATGSLNIRCSPWMDWFYGGIHFQVEHHLFPRLPRCHLRTIAPRVKEFCKKHKLQYQSAGFIEANRRTLKTLKDAAILARTMKVSGNGNLLWEALNTHG